MAVEGLLCVYLVSCVFSECVVSGRIIIVERTEGTSATNTVGSDEVST
jgi:hypothetical protein